MISYRTGNNLNLDDVIDLYRASTLGLRRPIDDRDRMQQMIRNANLVITAWDGDLLVGISRSVTDFSYATYLADLAVRESHQRQGIGITGDHHSPFGSGGRAVLSAHRIHAPSASLASARRRQGLTAISYQLSAVSQNQDPRPIRAES